MLTSGQIRGARGFLDISQIELSRATGIGIDTIRKIEADEENIEQARTITIKKVKEFLESKGIKFLSSQEDNNGAGVRYYKPSLPSNDF